MRKQGKIRNIAVVLKLSGASGRDILNGISTYAREHCYWRLRIFSRSEDFTPAALEGLPDLDGIITSERGSDEMVRILEQSQIPLVVIGIKNDWISKRTRKLVFVRNDDEDIGRFAADQFLSLGRFRSFGFVPSSERTYWSLLREKGFRSFLRQRSIRTEVCSGDISNWLTELPKPAAVMAAFDECAIKVLGACGEQGIDVPQQVAVIGVDNDELLCDFSDPPLTSILPDHIREGILAATALNKLLQSKKKTGSTTVLCRGKRIIRRESASPIAPMAQLVDKAIRFIRSNATSALCVDDVVRYLGVSRRLADQRFKDSSELSIARMIARTRLDEVAKRLRESTVQIRKIASDCSFDNLQHLANAFHRHFGMSMSAYRRSNQPSAKAYSTHS